MFVIQQGRSYHPHIDILKSNFDIQEGDQEIREKVQKGLRLIGVDEPSTLPYLLELLSVKDSGSDQIPMSPEARKDRIIDALKRILLRASEIRPLVMAFEDLHWLDKSSEDVLKSLLESIPGAKVLFSWFAVIRKRIAVVYYPLWVIRYSFRGQTYQALVDADDGTLAYGKAPGNHLFRALSLVGACAGACFVGTTLLQHLDVLLRSDDSLMALGAVGLVLAGFVAWGYRQFRRGGVVEEGSGLTDESAEPSLVRSIQGFMKEFSP